MSRRHDGQMNGERYLANADDARLELHDLDHEHAACQIDGILRAGTATPYHTLPAGRAAGYVDCRYCLGGIGR